MIDLPNVIRTVVDKSNGEDYTVVIRVKVPVTGEPTYEILSRDLYDSDGNKIEEN